MSLQSVLAEWQLFRIRLLRTRLGVWLAFLTAGLVALHARGGDDRLTLLALRAAMLAAVLAVAYGAGGDADRAALSLTLTHPTSRLALSLGRWLGAVTVATGVTVISVVAETAIAPEGTVGALNAARGIGAGVVAAGAAAGAALPGVWLLGNPVAAVLFLYIGLASFLSPAGLGLTSAPFSRVGSALVEALPGVWRYRGLAAGDLGASVHVAIWSIGGVVLAGLIVGRAHR